MMNETEGVHDAEKMRLKKRMYKGALLVLVVLAIFLAAKTIAEVKGWRYIGAGVPASNVISVEGDGDAVAIPDIATFSFSVVEKAKTVAEAQDAATKKLNAAVDYLKGAKVNEKDIKTTGYNVSPQYDYLQAAACSQGYCPPGKQVLSGYEVRQSIEVKVRDTKQAGDLLTGIGATGASELSGLTFTIDDDSKLKDEARGKAIDQAKGRANELAKRLGVSLVRIVNFNENTGGYPTPMYYSRDAMNMSGGVMAEKAVAPQVPTGENKITSHVTITYEIR